MTSIYLAGKIGKNDWRHDIVTGLRGAWGLDGWTPRDPWPTLPKAIGELDYIGPYFMSDDHGCGHGDGTHGCGPDALGMCGRSYDTPGRFRVRDLCLTAIRNADIVFAWLNNPTAYGTLVELGYAAACGKEIVIAAPELPMGWHDWGGHSATPIHDANPLDDMWFAFSVARREIQAPTPRAAIDELLADYPRLDSPIEVAFWKAYRATPPRGPLAGLVTQHPVLGGQYRLDFALPDRKIGIELDGFAYHSSREAFTKDRERQRQIEAAGWRIIRFSGAEITADAAACVRQAAELVTTFGAPVA